VRYAGVRTDVTCAFHFVLSLLKAGLLESCLRLPLPATYCVAPGVVRFTFTSAYTEETGNRNATHPEQEINGIISMLTRRILDTRILLKELCLCDLISDRNFKLRAPSSVVPCYVWAAVIMDRGSVIIDTGCTTVGFL
jgi:hypothetical protein